MVAQRGTVGTSGAGARAATTGAWRRKSTVVRMSSADSPVRGAGAADAARGDEHVVDVSCPVEDFGEGLLVSAVTGNVQHGVVGILSQAHAVHPGEGGPQPVGVAGGSRMDGPGGTPAARAAGSRMGPRAVRPAMMAARAQVSSVIAERRNSMSCLAPTGTVQVRRVSDARRKPKPRLR